MVAKAAEDGYGSARTVANVLGISELSVRRLAREGRIGTLSVEGVRGCRYSLVDARALREVSIQPAKVGAAARLRLARAGASADQ